jgi:hypothetical protein
MTYAVGVIVFAILLAGTAAPEQATALTKRLEEKMRAFREPARAFPSGVSRT